MRKISISLNSMLLCWQHWRRHKSDTEERCSAFPARPEGQLEPLRGEIWRGVLGTWDLTSALREGRSEGGGGGGGSLKSVSGFLWVRTVSRHTEWPARPPLGVVSFKQALKWPQSSSST